MSLLPIKISLGRLLDEVNYNSHNQTENIPYTFLKHLWSILRVSLKYSWRMHSCPWSILDSSLKDFWSIRCARTSPKNFEVSSWATYEAGFQCSSLSLPNSGWSKINQESCFLSILGWMKYILYFISLKGLFCIVESINKKWKIWYFYNNSAV